MKKFFVLITALIVLAVLAGCNADQIAGFGKGMENLSDLGLGQKRKEPMNAAIENIKTYIETTEKCFSWPEDMDFDGEKDVSATLVKFSDTTGKLFRDNIEATIKKLLAAKDSSANSKELHNALNARYTGVTKDAKTEKTVYKILKRSPNSIAGIMVNLLKDEEGHLNPAFARQRLKMFGLSDKAIDAVVSLIEKELPMPVSTYDYFITLELLTSKFMDLMSVYQSISGSSGGSGKKVDLSALQHLKDGITKSIGNRDYGTVGDRLAFNILYYVIYSLSEVNDKYKASEAYARLDDNHKYDEFFEFALNDDIGFGFFDKVLNSLQAIGYIYDVELDVAGLISGAI